MAKALFVLDEMSECCGGDCPLYEYDGEAPHYLENLCHGFPGRKYPRPIEDMSCKPSWCPLKEMPKELPIIADIDYITGYNTGWNDCIEHIEED